MPSMYAVSVCMGLIRASKNQAAIGAAESKRIAEHARHRLLAIIQQIVEVQRRVELPGVQPGGQQAVLQPQRAITAPMPPAAPRVWPVAPLVELHGVLEPNTV